MRTFLILNLLLFRLISFGQEIDVKRDKFPGVKQIIVISCSHKFLGIFCKSCSGFWATYLFDNKGQAVLEERYKAKEHLETTKYVFSEKGLLLKEIISYDINNPYRTDTFFYDYKIKDGKIYSESSYNYSQIVYQIHNIEFNEKGQSTKYIRNKNESVNYLTHENDLVKTWKCIDLKDSSETLYFFDYDKHGNIKKMDISYNPEPKIKSVWLGISGYGDHRRYKYKYNNRGLWRKKYIIIGLRRVLIEKRKYIFY